MADDDFSAFDDAHPATELLNEMVRSVASTCAAKGINPMEYLVVLANLQGVIIANTYGISDEQTVGLTDELAKIPIQMIRQLRSVPPGVKLN